MVEITQKIMSGALKRVKMNELYEKVAKDETLQAEVAEILKTATADNLAEIKEKLVAFAKRQG